MKMLALVALAAAAALCLGPASGARTSADDDLVVALSMPAPGFQVGAVRGRTVVLAKGFEIDLARAIGTRLGVKRVRFVNEPLFSTLLRPAGKDWDFALAEITITPQRRKQVDFSTPYLQADQGVLMRKGVPAVKTIAALRKLQLCAERTTTAGQLIVSTIKPVKKPILAESPDRATALLFSGRCDAVIADAPTLGVARDEAPDRYGALAGRIVTNESFAAAFARGNPLRPAVNRALAALQADGTIARLQRRWLTTSMTALPVIR